MSSGLRVKRNIGIDFMEQYPNKYGVGRIQTTIDGRMTELLGDLRIAYGVEIPATDTIGEALREGKKRCNRCQQFKDEQAFSRWLKKETGVVYVKRYCNHCRREMEKTRRFSMVESVN